MDGHPGLSFLQDAPEFHSRYIHTVSTSCCCDFCFLFCLLECFYSGYATLWNRLGGLVVKASASRAEDPGFESCLRRNFSGSSHTSDFKIGTPVATLPGAWRYRVSAGTGRPGVSIL